MHTVQLYDLLKYISMILCGAYCTSFHVYLHEDVGVNVCKSLCTSVCVIVVFFLCACVCVFAPALVRSCNIELLFSVKKKQETGII